MYYGNVDTIFRQSVSLYIFAKLDQALKVLQNSVEVHYIYVYTPPELLAKYTCMYKFPYLYTYKQAVVGIHTVHGMLATVFGGGKMALYRL